MESKFRIGRGEELKVIMEKVSASLAEFGLKIEDSPQFVEGELEYTVSLFLDRDAIASLHDTILDAHFGKIDASTLTDEKVLEYWNVMPEHIKDDVVHWGMSDTPTRDNIHVWLQDSGTLL